jgi:sec-independent protein translocase protein TatC
LIAANRLLAGVSSIIDEDTARTINGGRETLGAMLSAAQTHLQKVFIVFVVGLIGTIMLLYYWGWSILKRDLLVRAEGADVFAITPFDVILLQVKIGMIVGVVLSLPPVVYFAREPLRQRGMWPAENVARWKLALLSVLAVGLAAVGVAYGYFLFFPIMFDFLAQSAIDSSFAPDYAIVQWAEFILFLLISFALAAQLPLFMSALSYAGIVRYQTWRDQWRIAVMVIFGFGAVFSPPDPFTQIMWAAPLLALYGFSLYLTKFVVLLKFSRDRIGFGATAWRRWNRILAGGFVLGAVVYVFLSADVGPTLRGLLGILDPTATVPSPAVFGLSRAESVLLWSGAAGVVGALAAFGYYVLAAAEEAALEQGYVVGDPTAIDLSVLDAAGVRAAPPEPFEEMTEDEAVELASAAINEGDRERARAILDRWDVAHPDVDGALGGQSRDAGTPTRTRPTDTWTKAAGNPVALLALGAERVDWRRRLGALWNVLLGVAVLAVAGVYVAYRTPYGPAGLPALPELPALGLVGTAATLAAGAFAGLALAALLALVIAGYAAYAAATDPSAVDLTALTAGGVETAPPALFAGLTEDDATHAAEEAMSRGNDAKARTILDRFDEIQARQERRREQEAAAAEEGTVVTSTAAGVASAFSEEETSEEEIGGYLYDLQFVVSSLTSKSFRLIGLFMLVTGGSFFWLYGGVGPAGIGLIMRDFLSRLPETVRPEEVLLVTLHPVEHLVFIVKMSTILGFGATLPLLLYYAWPALATRGFVSGDRGALLRWSVVSLLALVAGSLVGYAYVAPSIISWLANDAVQASMIVKYRINSFGWLVFFTTVGVGILACVPAVMFMLHRSGLVGYARMRDHWREVTIGLIAFGAVFSPRGLFTMFLLSLPLAIMYYVGIALLWAYTLGGRRTPARSRQSERAD